ncbi:MAG: SGNH/GDSL hydrolase family protein [Solirubrobacteraceae bacterium]
MRALWIVLLAAFAAGVAPAFAGLPPGDDPPGDGGDPSKDHVYRLKPWKARLQYRVMRTSRAYAELNSRSDVAAEVQKDQWWPIDCQLTSTTQNGQVLWDHIPNVGWVADKNLKTYSAGRLEGSPTCPDPTGNHVWFQQPWAAAKEYRLTRNSVVRTRPGGAINPLISLPKGLFTPIQCSNRTGKKTWIRLSSDGQGHEGWINAKALRFWQKGLPQGLPGCVSSTPRRMVVLGDSYAAGIGAGSFYEDSGSCYQSSQSYWATLATQLAPGFQSIRADFEACTGDKTAQLRSKLAYVLNQDTGLVTVSIGGNDMHFADILDDCVKPGPTTCENALKKYFTDAALAATRAKLAATYDEIRAKAPNATVLVLGYPRLVPADHIDRCGAMSDDDAPRLARTANQLNDVIAAAVHGRAKFRFVGLVKTFAAHPACNLGQQDWINGFNSQAGGKASFHPNVPGNAAIAQRIREAAPRFFG